MSRTKKIVRRWLGPLLIVAGLGWTLYLLVDLLEHPEQVLPRRGGVFLLSTVLMVAALGLNFFLFRSFLEKGGSSARLMRLYFTGQILRYLPARIWGVVYQIQAAGEEYSSADIIRANVSLMVFLLVGNTTAALLVMGWRLKFSPLLLVAIALVGAGLLAGIFLGGAARLAHVPAGWLPARLGRFVRELADIRLTPGGLLFNGGVLGASWACYLWAWQLLGLSCQRPGDIDFLLLCAYYTVASLVGIVSAVTPAGLGVREAAFVVLARTAAGLEEAAFFAWVGRIWFLLAELFLFVLAGVVAWLSGHGRKT